MKTQIKTLIHGNPSTHGTNSHDRAAIAAKVIEENPRELTVEVFGHALKLCAHYSTSGKTVTYAGPVTHDDIITEVARNNNWQDGQQTVEAIAQGLAYVRIQINSDMTAELQVFHRRTDRCLWRHSKTLRIEESTITIL